VKCHFVPFIINCNFESESYYQGKKKYCEKQNNTKHMLR